MIAQLTGLIVKKQENAVILNVSGVGYKVHIGKETRAALRGIGEEASLWTHLSVRETSLDLFGFLEHKDLAFFELLIAISGIGPKSALAILDVADVDTLQSAIRAGESTYLTKVSGIGRKNAEKIILELKDKLGVEMGMKDDTMVQEEIDTLDALSALGYSTREARDALKQVPKDVEGTNERLREALKFLGKN